MSHLALSFLGPPGIALNGIPQKMNTRKATALLAYLAVTGQSHSRDRLASLFWPESGQQQGRAALRTTLSNLRITLGESWFITDAYAIGLKWQTDIQVDVTDFRRLLQKAMEGSHTADGDEQRNQYTALAEATALYRSDFLTGFTLSDSSDFDEWQFFERESLRQGYAQALERLIHNYSAKQAFADAIPFARRWVALDPLHEPAQCKLMQLYADAGNWTDALRQYRECERILAEELGVTPDAETTVLYERICNQPRVQAVPREETPSQALAMLVQPHTRLPTRLTSFVGRVQELNEVNRQVKDPLCRLLTLIGPGGIGKTRLAIEVASQLADSFAYGVHYIDLVSLRSVQLLVPTVAQAIGLAIADRSESEQQLLKHLQTKEMLLLFDNFEHLLEGSNLLSVLLSQCPHVKILVTSRIALKLEEEWLYFVAGLDLPNADLLAAPASYSSVRLFVQRARQLDATFSINRELEAIVQICQLVDGVPLAIELAAAWIQVLSCVEIVKEIRQNLDFLTSPRRSEAERHSSLRAVFEYSWHMLSPTEQQLLAQLSVFRGGFTRTAVVQITTASLFALFSLVNKSLLQRTNGERFTMHELLSQFAAEKLQTMSTLEFVVYKNHAHYYGAFLQQRESWWDSEREQEAITHIQAELPNVRAGWKWAAEQREEAVLVRYVIGLYAFYDNSARYQEGEDAFALAVTNLLHSNQIPLPFSGDSVLLPSLLIRQAQFCQETGHPDTAIALVQQSMTLLQNYPDQTMDLALAHMVLGAIYYFQGQYKAARQSLLQSIKITPNGLPGGKMANAYLFLGAVSYALGYYTEAAEYQRTSLDIYRKMRKLWGIAHANRWLGMTAQTLKQYEIAQTYYAQSRAAFESINNLDGIALCSNSLGQLSQAIGDYAQARDWFDKGLQLYQKNDDRFGIIRSRNLLGDIACLLGDYKEARTHLQKALQGSIDICSAPLTLQALLGIATMLEQEYTVTANQLLKLDTESAQLERAFAIYRLVLQHEASYEELRGMAHTRYQQLVTKIPSHIVQHMESAIVEQHRTLESAVNRLVQGVAHSIAVL